MIRKYLLPVLAIAGFAFAIFMVMRGNRPVPAAPPVNPPPQARFAKYVSAAGLVEAASENIAIGTPVSGVVLTVAVQVGDRVKAHDPLFRIDDRELKAQLASQEAGLRVAQAQLDRLSLMPRAEDVPPLAAKVEQQRAILEDLRAQLARLKGVADSRAVSQDDVTRRQYAVKAAEAQLTQAETQLAQLKAGAWKPDLEVARAQVDLARASMEETQVELERLMIRSPIDGEVLQVQVRPGEFAPAGVLGTPLMIIGDTSCLHVRVEVDENDSWRVQPGSPAQAFARGNREISVGLAFVRFEPLVVPKKSLTGESTERVDTRVLQVVYAITEGHKSSALPLYVGQQMDVFIEAPEKPVGSEPGQKAGS